MCSSETMFSNAIFIRIVQSGTSLRIPKITGNPTRTNASCRRMKATKLQPATTTHEPAYEIVIMELTPPVCKMNFQQ